MDETNLRNDIFVWTVTELLRFLRIASPSLLTYTINNDVRRAKPSDYPLSRRIRQARIYKTFILILRITHV